MNFIICTVFVKSVYFGSQNQHFARKIVSTYFSIAFWFCSTRGRRDFGHSRVFSMLFRQNCSLFFQRIHSCDNSTSSRTIWYRSLSDDVIIWQVVLAASHQWLYWPWKPTRPAVSCGFLGQDNHSCDISTQKIHSYGFPFILNTTHSTIIFDRWNSASKLGVRFWTYNSRHSKGCQR